VSLTRNGGAGEKLYPLFACRLYAHGRQLVFPLYTMLVQAIGATPGDLVLVRVHLPFVTFRIANPDLALPIMRFDHDQLPPTYREVLEEIAKAIR
jgi:hypothetical protein